MRLLVSGTTRTMGDQIKRYGQYLGWLTTPRAGNRLAGPISTSGLPWAIDNGAYSGLDEAAFRRLLQRSKRRSGCLFVVVPDVVADARATLEMFERWKDEVRGYGHPLAFVGQDGAEDLDIPWGEFGAWFIGGSTEWKLSLASDDLAAEAKRRGKHVHMGRVNSLRRMRIAFDFGCDSVDGSSMSKFGEKYIGRFCRWVAALNAQPVLF